MTLHETHPAAGSVGPPLSASGQAAAATTRLPAVRDRSAGTGGGRDRYLDLLRALALVRVFTYHTFGWAWLTLVFPSMGVMFALAGSLMARSLDRPAVAVIRGRMRRLLPPVWAFGLIVVTAMLLHGWAPASAAERGSWWARMLFWILPLNDPPGNHWALQVTGPLWYVRAYLWFVILSPLLLRAFRRRPWVSIVSFLVLAAVMQTGVVPLVDRVGGLDDTLTDFATFGACWLLGFAHRDGLLRRIPPVVVAAIAVPAMALGGWYAFTYQTSDGYDLGEIPLAQAFWSVGFVLLLLRFHPGELRWLSRVRPLDTLVSAFNARAVTIYLWHEVALVVSVPLIDLMWNVPAFEMSLPLDATWFQFLVAWPLLGVAVLAFGWIEDRAAKRPARLWPVGGVRGRERPHTSSVR